MSKIRFEISNTPFVWRRFLVLNLILVLISLGSVSVLADEAYSARSNGNKTISVQWTLNDNEPNHVLKCIAEGNPLPTLSWIRDEDKNFTTTTGINVDVSKPDEISITFNPITYGIRGDYFCVAAVPGNESFKSYTDFRVSVETDTSTGVVVGAVVILLVFLGAAFFVCKFFRINDGAVRIET